MGALCNSTFDRDGDGDLLSVRWPKNLRMRGGTVTIRNLFIDATPRTFAPSLSAVTTIPLHTLNRLMCPQRRRSLAMRLLIFQPFNGVADDREMCLDAVETTLL